MKHVELFSGIGGFRRAIELVGHDLGVTMDCVGFSEIDTNASRTYGVNFNTEGDLVMGDIVAFTSCADKIRRLGDFDLLTGGFPCQTFSMMGGQAGFDEDRGKMFFRIMDIVRVKHPKYILLENVKNLVNHDKGRTIRRIVEELEGAGYRVKYDVFNTHDFGLPQTRNRTIIFARAAEAGDFSFTSETVRTTFGTLDRTRCSLDFYGDVTDILAAEVPDKYYLSDKIKPTILSDGSANYRSNSDIDKRIARPLTASMHKMHRACQDNYYSDAFIESKGRIRPSETLTKEQLARIPIRRLTPREAFMLQGFPGEFADRAMRDGVPDGALYKQAGNAVSVNLIYAVLHHLITNDIIGLK